MKQIILIFFCLLLSTTAVASNQQAKQMAQEAMVKGYEHLNQALIAVKQRKSLKKSFDYFFLASQYDPANPMPHIALARAYYANRQENQARDQILKAKELSTGNSPAYYEIGHFYYKIGDYDNAERYIRTSIRIAQNNKASMLLDNINAQREQLLVKAEPVEMTMPPDYYLMLDQFTEAREGYIKQLQVNPNNVQAVAGLAELYYAKWIEGFITRENFTSDAISILKAPVSKENEVSILKFQISNQGEMTEEIRQKLLTLSMSGSSVFIDMLNKVRADFLLGDYNASNDKLAKLLKTDLSDKEKTTVLKCLYFDRNYYAALDLLEDFEEHAMVKERIYLKPEVAEEKAFEDAIRYFPTYKPTYLHYAEALEENENYDMAYEMMNIYYDLYKIYPDRDTELTEKEIQKKLKKLDKKRG